MRVAINTRFLLPGKLEGIGRFTHEILQRMVKAKPDWEFIFIFDRPFDSQFIYSSNVTPVVVGPPARHPILFWNWFERKIPKVIKQYNPDIFLSPDGYLSLRSSINQIAVIHDLAFEHFPEGISRVNLWHYKKYFPQYIHKAVHLLSVSQTTSTDIQKLYKIPSDKITLVHNAANQLFKPVSDEIKKSTRKVYSDQSEYFVYVGAIHPRKNLINLLLAFEYFHQSNTNIKLLIVGRKGWKNKELDKLYDTLSSKKNIIFTGRVDDEVLAEIIGSAKALCYPSLFEGFGIPILEAMQCGVPVITSNVSSMIEVSNGAALLANPLSPTEISECMKLIVNDQDLVQTLIDKGLEQAKKYTWDDATQIVIDVLSKYANA